MYHYVKDFKKYAFAKLKGLDVREFEAQIKFLKSKFIILDPQDIHEIASKKKIFKLDLNDIIILSSSLALVKPLEIAFL